MASRLDKVIGIYVRVPTQDTQYGPEYTFTKPSTSTTFMYYYYQLQYLTLHTLYFFSAFSRRSGNYAIFPHLLI